jgi:signal transduction histidine kinase
MAEETTPSKDRDRTDDSLREEREKTDRVLAERRQIEEDADESVRHSREESDASVHEARTKADEEQAQEGRGKASNAAVTEARAAEDEALQEERSAADENLRREREESARALRMLFPLERSKTDRHLLTERARSDDDVSKRDAFMGIASHDLRSLLGGIVLSADAIARRVTNLDTEEGEKILAETKRIERYTARMNRLIGDLVDIASINAGNFKVLPEEGDAAKTIAEAVELFEPFATEKEIDFEATLVQQPLPARFDYDRVLQVLANFITNAIKFTSEGGSIRIRAERNGDEVLISVSDTGCGIPSDMLTAVFERFWQVGQNDPRGTGLGLYISKYIVEAHGGRIWAESTPGEGSIFRFTIPGAADDTPSG